MPLKIRTIYSKNFIPRERKRNQIRFLVLHYTGMKKENEAIKRLIGIQSQVSTHYFVKNNGEIIRMVPDLYKAWHAGISQWGKYSNLNKYSIGIEISNPGHMFGYSAFPKKQIRNLIKLLKQIIKNYKIKPNCILGHSDIAPDRKKDPGEKFPWKVLNKNNIGIWHNININKLKSLRKKKIPAKESQIFIKKLKKLGYPFKSIIVKDKKKYEKLLVKAFQRRFRPEVISGKIDQECLLIAQKLLK